jgi:hypothetical protein
MSAASRWTLGERSRRASGALPAIDWSAVRAVGRPSAATAFGTGHLLEAPAVPVSPRGSPDASHGPHRGPDRTPRSAGLPEGQQAGYDQWPRVGLARDLTGMDHLATIACLEGEHMTSPRLWPRRSGATWARPEGTAVRAAVLSGSTVRIGRRFDSGGSSTQVLTSASTGRLSARGPSRFLNHFRWANGPRGGPAGPFASVPSTV